MRTTFPVYVIALTSVVSWVLFMVFAGVGVSAIPVDEIKAFLARPKKVIAKSEYIRIAGKIAEETKSVLEEAREVQREERSAGRTRKTRRALAKIEKRLASLEDDELTLQRMFPQGEDRDVRWTLTVMGYYGHLAAGVVSAIVSTAWIVHVCVYVFPDQPPGTFLNGFFVALDSVWGLFGTVAFALFCFYLILCVVKGCVKVGFPLLIFTVYPMKLGGTLMGSFLFNVELIMLSSVAVIQFCTRAFDGYAAETSVSDIFGGEIENLGGWGSSSRNRCSCTASSRARGWRPRARRHRGERVEETEARVRVDMKQTETRRRARERRRQTGAISKHDEALDGRRVCKGNAFGGQVQSSRSPARRRGGETPPADSCTNGFYVTSTLHRQMVTQK